MLIICTGPDTWSAHEKARDLAKGFRDKYDSTGASVTTIHEATFSEVMNQFGAPSLFAKKVFVRADGWMSKIKPEDFKKLHERILKDGDMTILVAVMDELPVKIDSDQVLLSYQPVLGKTVMLKSYSGKDLGEAEVVQSYKIDVRALTNRQLNEYGQVGGRKDFAWVVKFKKIGSY